MKNTVSAIAMSLGGFALVGGLVFTFAMLGLARPGARYALPRTQRAMARLKAHSLARV